ncbi:MAG: hypothetical protein ACRCX8_19560 [Sarcina sp.]
MIDLDLLAADTELKIDNKLLHIPAFKVSFADRFTKAIAKSSEILKTKDVEQIKNISTQLNDLLLEYLNSNRDGIVFVKEWLENDISNDLLKALINHIANQVFNISKN